MLQQNIDVICIAESKLYSYFPESQFRIPGYTIPYRHDVTGDSGGLLIYVKETIPSKILTDFTLPKEIQAIPIELNFRKSKWLLLLFIDPIRCRYPSLFNRYQHFMIIILIVTTIL